MPGLKTERKTGQHLMPLKKTLIARGRYDIYPAFSLDGDKFLTGYQALAAEIAKDKLVTIDGFAGVFFRDFSDRLGEELSRLNKKVKWHFTDSYLKAEEEINVLTSPFTGGDDPLFGTRTTLDLGDFYDLKSLQSAHTDPEADINIIIGIGAALAGWGGMLVYIDLPKNELQYRARAGSAANIGVRRPASGNEIYKRFYFVDWVVLGRHKARLLPALDLIIDGQHPEHPVCVRGDDLRTALGLMSRNFFRVRPWFEPGSWGGRWIMNNIEGVNREVVNYAWSFELITPENGLIIENNGYMLEVSFDTLMFHDHNSVLGRHASRYGTEFPIRFDFLDTMEGGNLSVQCHPRPEYITEHFGESFTQEETYYIIDAAEDAKCYLGFQESVNPESFEKELWLSYNERKQVDITKYVQVHDSHRHDLFLIPPGTIHGSGRGNLVLEISTTPYIFTFKMYDWVRPDLDGNLRPLNIKRGMDNLYFDRQGTYVQEKLISKPVLIDEGPDWKLYDQPTHENHSYSVHRYIFMSEITVTTDNSCHVLSLVEGTSIMLISAGGLEQRFHFAETFVVPAAAGSYRIVNEGIGEAVVVKAFMK